MNHLVKCLTGSKLYCLDNPNSDTDYASIYLPTVEQLLLGKAPGLINAGTSNASRKNTVDDTDHSVYSLAYFITQACNGKQQIIDMLHANANVTLHTSFIWMDLQLKRKRIGSVDFIAKQIATYGDRVRANDCLEQLDKALEIVGRCRRNVKLYNFAELLPVNDYTYFVVRAEDGSFKEVKWSDHSYAVRSVFYRVDGSLIEVSLSYNQLVTTVEGKLRDHYEERKRLTKMNGGKPINWSEVSHAMRVGYQVLGILQNGDFEYPLPQSDFLRQIKSGALDFSNDVQPVAEQLIADVKRLMFTSDLPETADTEYWNNWLLSVYRKEFNINS